MTAATTAQRTTQRKAPAQRARDAERANGSGHRTRPAQRRNEPEQRAAYAQRAAARVVDRHTIHVRLPDNAGTIRLPEPQRLAFYGGMAALAAFGIIEWPVAVVLGVGHLLAEDHHHKCLCEFGEALAEA